MSKTNNNQNKRYKKISFIDRMNATEQDFNVNCKHQEQYAHTEELYLNEHNRYAKRSKYVRVDPAKELNIYKVSDFSLDNQLAVLGSENIQHAPKMSMSTFGTLEQIPD